MNIIVTFEASSTAELLDAMGEFIRERAPRNQDGSNVVPLNSGGGHPAAYTADQANPPGDQVNPRPAVTVDDLIAGMTLKPTATSSLGDGNRASVGDYIAFNGDAWHVYATYRGKLVVANEANVADVVDASDCALAPTEEAKPRPGTAAALLNQPDPNQRPADQAHAIGAPAAAAAAPGDTTPIAADEAARLRDAATAAVSSQKIKVDAVFSKLKEIGNVSSIDLLTAAQAVKFEAWLNGDGDSGDGKFGF